MLTHKEVADVIGTVRTELGLRPTQDMLNCKALKKAVVAKLAGTLHPIELAFLGLDNPQARLYDEDWVNVFAHVVVGKVLPEAVVEKIAAGKVAVLGQRSMPDGWGKLKFPVLDEPSSDPEVVYVGDDDGYEELGLTWLCPHEAAEAIVREVAITSSQVLAMVLLLGFEPNEKKTRWVLANGWAEDHVMGVHKGGATLNEKTFKKRIFLAGRIDGDPTTATPPWSAIFWCLVYALSGTSEQKKAARLRHLQQAFVEKLNGPVVRGLIAFRNEETLGRLAVYRGWNGAIQVCNAEAIPAEVGADASLEPAITAVETAGLLWTAQHQGGDLYVGAGAQACGMVADATNPEQNLTFQSVDKEPKFLQRTASLMIKASTEAEIVTIPGFDPYC